MECGPWHNFRSFHIIREVETVLIICFASIMPHFVKSAFSFLFSHGEFTYIDWSIM